jgi:hypothetical protein
MFLLVANLLLYSYSFFYFTHHRNYFERGRKKERNMKEREKERRKKEKRKKEKRRMKNMQGQKFTFNNA